MLAAFLVPGYKDSASDKLQPNTLNHTELNPKSDDITYIKENCNGIPEKEGPFVYLTFDDGPSEYTEKILKTLDDNDVSGNFFFIGDNMDKISSKGVQTIKDGCHTVGSHSMTHDKDHLYNQGQFVPENEDMFKLLKEKGISSRYVRAPYGSTYLSSEEVKEINEKNWKLLDWNIDSLDWKFNNTQQTINYINRQLNQSPNQQTLVILMHEKSTTVPILNQLIKELKQRDYQIVSLEQRPVENINFR